MKIYTPRDRSRRLQPALLSLNELFHTTSVKYSMKFNIFVWLSSCIVFINAHVYAQDSLESKSVLVLDLGAGIGALQNVASVISFDVRWRTGHQMLSAQCIDAKEIGFNIPIFHLLFPKPRERTTAISVLYGRVHYFHLKRMLFPLFPLAAFFRRETDYSVSASIGVSVCYNLLRYENLIEGENIGIRNVTIGVPVQVELAQQIVDNVSYVHRLQYQWSKRRDVWGIQWGLQAYF